MAGAPLGNQNAKKARIWSNAIERALHAWPNRPTSLSVNTGIDTAAFEFVSKLMDEKDITFFRELGDRIDGKPAQAVDLDASLDAGPGLLGILATMGKK